MTMLEQVVFQFPQITSLAVPEPLMNQMKHLDDIQTKTGKHPYPEFSQLPEEEINGYGGFYVLPGTNTNDTIHNMTRNESNKTAWQFSHQNWRAHVVLFLQDKMNLMLDY